MKLLKTHRYPRSNPFSRGVTVFVEVAVAMAVNMDIGARYGYWETPRYHEIVETRPELRCVESPTCHPCHTNWLRAEAMWRNLH